MQPPPNMPPARFVDLPGRGRTWVYDSGPPADPDGDGDRTPLVLLHGWTSTAAGNWGPSVPALASRYRVVALDHRGHGRGLRSRSVFRLEDCADDVAALIDVLELGPCTVVGYSMGGPIAQLLWHRHRRSVRELVLCATAARFAGRRQFQGLLGTVSLCASLAVSMVPGGLRQHGMVLAARGRLSGGADGAWVLDEWRLHHPGALMQAGLALSRFDSTGWIGRIDVPTAVVVTEFDSTVSPRRQRLLADSIPGALAFPVQGDHRVCVDSPRRFVPVLMSACEAVRRRSTLPV